MKKYLFFLILACNSAAVSAQFISQGSIAFERKTNLRQSMQTETESDWIKEHIKEVAQFTLSDFTLIFNPEHASYVFDKEQEVEGMKLDWGGAPAHKNRVFTNYRTGRITAEKTVYENTYTVDEALPRFEWKIMDEMRVIAGYPCRKAVTRICDSVVVVAFYCDQIMVSGGPESFNGLPGMILGLAIPRLYTTWFATSVNVLPQEPQPFRPARKSRQVTTDALAGEIKKDTKDWGKYSAKLLWWVHI